MEIHRTRIGLPLLAALLLLSLEARAQGDLDLLVGSSAPPNMMLFLDNSSSMDADVSGDPLGRMRIEVGHDVFIELLNTINPTDDVSGEITERARFGFATFNTKNEPLYTDGKRGAGATIDVPVGPATNKASIIAALDALLDEYVNDDLTSSGTPISEALLDLGRYFAEGHVLGNYPTDLQADRIFNDPQEEDEGDLQTYEPICSGPCPSPVDAECRKNFVLLVTDGGPNRDKHDHYGVPIPESSSYNDGHPYSVFKDFIGNGDGDANECSLLFSDPAFDPSCMDDPMGGRDDGEYYSSDPRGDWLDDVAYVLNRTDMHPVIPGMQNLVTYPIGFAFDTALLQETADNSDSVYYTADTAEELKQAMLAATAAIFDSLVAFSAASVPSSRSAFGDGFYAAHFEPSASDAFWPGHLQAFRLSPSLVVLDKLGNPALDPNTNSFKEPRQYFWDAGEELAKATHPARKLYTTQPSGRTSFDTSKINNAVDLDIQASDLTLYPNYPTINFGSKEELADSLVEYLTGQDIFDEDEDGDTTELRAAVLGDHELLLVHAQTPRANHLRGRKRRHAARLPRR
jgi:hypothetical protein